MMQIPDHPAIREAERIGIPEPEQTPRCPVCGQECEFIYRSARTLEIYGCDMFVEAKEAWETPECFPDEE